MIDKSTLALISAEREHQIERWGDPSHDDQHEPLDWTDIIETYNLKAYHDAADGDDDEFRRRMVQIAALAVAAIESHDRKLEKHNENDHL